MFSNLIKYSVFSCIWLWVSTATASNPSKTSYNYLNTKTDIVVPNPIDDNSRLNTVSSKTNKKVKHKKSKKKESKTTNRKAQQIKPTDKLKKKESSTPTTKVSAKNSFKNSNNAIHNTKQTKGTKIEKKTSKPTHQKAQKIKAIGKPKEKELWLAPAPSATKNPPKDKLNYCKIKAGIVIPTSIDGNSGMNNPGQITYTAGAAIGRRVEEIFSAEIEYMYRAKNTTKYSVPQESNSITSWPIKAETLMLNLAVDLMTNSRITPYAKAGIGFSKNKAYAYNFTEVPLNNTTRVFPGKTTHNFAWQIGAGINFKYNSTYSSEIEYMFVNRGTVETYGVPPKTAYGTGTPPIKGNFWDQTITIGIKINF